MRVSGCGKRERLGDIERERENDEGRVKIGEVCEKKKGDLGKRRLFRTESVVDESERVVDEEGVVGRGMGE